MSAVASRDQSDSRTEEVAAGKIGSQDKADAGKSGWQTHGPFVYPAGDFRCNQRQPEIKDGLVGIEIAIDRRYHPFTFGKHDPDDFAIAWLHRRP